MEFAARLDAAALDRRDRGRIGHGRAGGEEQDGGEERDAHLRTAGHGSGLHSKYPFQEELAGRRLSPSVPAPCRALDWRWDAPYAPLAAFCARFFWKARHVIARLDGSSVSHLRGFESLSLRRKNQMPHEGAFLIRGVKQKFLS